MAYFARRGRPRCFPIFEAYNAFRFINSRRHVLNSAAHITFALSPPHILHWDIPGFIHWMHAHLLHHIFSIRALLEFLSTRYHRSFCHCSDDSHRISSEAAVWHSRSAASHLMITYSRMRDGRSPHILFTFHARIIDTVISYMGKIYFSASVVKHRFMLFSPDALSFPSFRWRRLFLSRFTLTYFVRMNI